jgi:hypothetical protein
MSGDATEQAIEMTMCTCSREGITFVVDEAVEQARFARSGITNDDEFKQVIVSLGHPLLFLAF